MTRSRWCVLAQLCGAFLFFTALYDLVGPEWSGLALGAVVVVVATLAERAPEPVGPPAGRADVGPDPELVSLRERPGGA